MAFGTRCPFHLPFGNGHPIREGSGVSGDSMAPYEEVDTCVPSIGGTSKVLTLVGVAYRV